MPSAVKPARTAALARIPAHRVERLANGRRAFGSLVIGRGIVKETFVDLSPSLFDLSFPRCTIDRNEPHGRSVSGGIPRVRRGAARLSLSLRAQRRRRRRAPPGNLRTLVSRRRRAGARGSALDPRVRAHRRAQRRAVLAASPAGRARSSWSRISSRSRRSTTAIRSRKSSTRTRSSRCSRGRGAPADALPPGIHAAQGLRPLAEGNRGVAQHFREHGRATSREGHAPVHRRARGFADRASARAPGSNKRAVARSSRRERRRKHRRRSQPLAGRARHARHRGQRSRFRSLARAPTSAIAWRSCKLEAAWQRTERLRELQSARSGVDPDLLRSAAVPWPLAIAASGVIAVASPSARWAYRAEFRLAALRNPRRRFLAHRARRRQRHRSQHQQRSARAPRARARSPARARRRPVRGRAR